MMHGTADQPMGIELSAERPQFAAASVAQDGLRDAQRTAKTCHDAAYRSDFYLRSRVADQVDLAIADAAFHRNPAAIDGNLGALPFHRLHVLAFEKTRKTFGSVVAFADDAQRGALW